MTFDKKQMSFVLRLDIVEKLEEMKRLYNRSMTELIEIAVSSLYNEKPNISNDYSLLGKFKIALTSENISIEQFCIKHNVSRHDVYRVLKQIELGKNIIGYGDKKENYYYKTKSAKLKDAIVAMIQLPE